MISIFLLINFNQEHKAMLSHCIMLLEDGCIVINPIFDKLVISLKTAIDDNGIDKKTTSYNDTFDAFRLALRYYKINQSGKRGEWSTSAMSLKLSFTQNDFSGVVQYCMVTLIGKSIYVALMAEGEI